MSMRTTRFGISPTSIIAGVDFDTAPNRVTENKYEQVREEDAIDLDEFAHEDPNKAFPVVDLSSSLPQQQPPAQAQILPSLPCWPTGRFIDVIKAIKRNDSVQLKALLGPDVPGFKQKEKQERLFNRGKIHDGLKLTHEINCINAVITIANFTHEESKMAGNPSQPILNQGSKDIITKNIESVIENKMNEVTQEFKNDINHNITYEIAAQRNIKREHAEQRLTDPVLQSYENGQLAKVRRSIVKDIEKRCLKPFKRTGDFSKLVKDLKLLLSKTEKAKETAEKIKKTIVLRPFSSVSGSTPVEQAWVEYERWMTEAKPRLPNGAIREEFIRIVREEKMAHLPLAQIIASPSHIYEIKRTDETNSIERGDTFLHVALRKYAATPLAEQGELLPLIGLLMERCSPYVENAAGKTAFDVANEVSRRLQGQASSDSKKTYPDWSLVRMACERAPVFSDYARDYKKEVLFYCQGTERVISRTKRSRLWGIIYRVIYNMEIKTGDRLMAVRELVELLYKAHGEHLTDVPLHDAVRKLDTEAKKKKWRSALFKSLKQISPDKQGTTYLNLAMLVVSEQDCKWLKEQEEQKQLGGQEGIDTLRQLEMQAAEQVVRIARHEEEIGILRREQEVKDRENAEKDTKREQEITNLKNDFAGVCARLLQSSISNPFRQEGIEHKTSAGNVQSAMPDQTIRLEENGRQQLFKENDKFVSEIKYFLEESKVTAGIAYDNGDCFFDSVAQALKSKNISIPGQPHEPDHKRLRLLCHNYMVRSLSWVKEALGEDKNTKEQNYKERLAQIAYTDEEIKGLKRQGLRFFSSWHTIWGHPFIDGRMICQMMKDNINKEIKLHVIELSASGELQGSQKLKQAHYLVDKDGKKDIDAHEVDYQDFYTLHLIAYKNHFVPLKPIRMFEPASPWENSEEQRLVVR